MSANASNVVSRVLQACSERRMTTLQCGNIVLNMEHLTTEDLKDSGCRELLMTSVMISHESHILKMVELNLNPKQKENTVAGFFEGSNAIQPDTYKRILSMLALAMSTDPEVVVNQEQITMSFKDDDAEARCLERARNATVQELVASLKAARLNETKNINELRKSMMKCHGEWAAKIAVADKLLAKNRTEQALVPVSTINTEKVKSLFAENLRQKMWMDLYGVLSPHMTALAFNANMATALAKGFDKAKTDFDESLDAVLAKEMEIDGYKYLIARETERLSALTSMKAEEVGALERMRAQLQQRLRDLDAEHANLQRKVESSQDGGCSVSILWFSFDNRTDRSSERQSLTNLMELNREQRRETDTALSNLSTERVKQEGIKQSADIQKTIDVAKAQKDKANQEITNLRQVRDEKRKEFEKARQATADMLATTGACTREQALASLEAAQALEAAMGNASIETGVATRLYKSIQTALELVEFCKVDMCLFDDLKEELNGIAQTPLVKMLSDTISVTTLPIEYAAQLDALQERGMNGGNNLSVPTLTDEDSGRPIQRRRVEGC